MQTLRIMSGAGSNALVISPSTAYDLSTEAEAIHSSYMGWLSL
jgi:hypothetical protein